MNPDRTSELVGLVFGAAGLVADVLPLSIRLVFLGFGLFLFLRPIVQRRLKVTTPIIFGAICLAGLLVAFGWQVLFHGWRWKISNEVPQPATRLADTFKVGPGENFAMLYLINTKNRAVNNVSINVTKLDRSVTYLPASPSPDASFFFPVVYSGGGQRLPIKLAEGRYQLDVLTQEGNFLERVRVFRRKKESAERGGAYDILSDQEKQSGVQIMPAPDMFAVIARVEDELKDGDLTVAGTWLYNTNNELKYKTFQGFTYGPDGDIP